MAIRGIYVHVISKCVLCTNAEYITVKLLMNTQFCMFMYYLLQRTAANARWWSGCLGLVGKWYWQWETPWQRDTTDCYYFTWTCRWVTLFVIWSIVAIKASKQWNLYDDRLLLWWKTTYTKRLAFGTAFLFFCLIKTGIYIQEVTFYPKWQVSFWCCLSSQVSLYLPFIGLHNRPVPL